MWWPLLPCPQLLRTTWQEVTDGIQIAGSVSAGHRNWHLEKTSLMVKHRAENILFHTCYHKRLPDNPLTLRAESMPPIVQGKTGPRSLSRFQTLESEDPEHSQCCCSWQPTSSCFTVLLSGKLPSLIFFPGQRVSLPVNLEGPAALKPLGTWVVCSLLPSLPTWGLFKKSSLPFAGFFSIIRWSVELMNWPPKMSHLCVFCGTWDRTEKLVFWATEVSG